LPGGLLVHLDCWLACKRPVALGPAPRAEPLSVELSANEHSRAGTVVGGVGLAQMALLVNTASGQTD
jgi:hypothetical protein